MKLDEVIHKKRHPEERAAGERLGGFSKHALETEVERIFKWKANLSTLKMVSRQGWALDITVPHDISEEDFDFTVNMMKRKLPSLVKTHLSDVAKVGEFRDMYPQMKARPGQKIERRGLPPKVRIPIQ